MPTKTKWSSYKTINTAFASIIALMFIYTGIFYTPGLINCAVKSRTGKDCATCGLTRDFNSLLNFEWDQLINPISTPIFLFFFIQFILRSSLAIINTQKIGVIITDIIFSLSLFIYCFYPLIVR